MLVEPLLPVEVPVGWMILQKDQHRYSPSMTPGLTDIQPCNSWLSQLVKMVQLLIRVMFRIRWEVVAPSLSIVNWIRRRLSLYDKVKLISLGGGNVLLVRCFFYSVGDDFA